MVVTAVLLTWAPVGRKQAAPWAQREGKARLIHAESDTPCFLKMSTTPNNCMAEEKWTFLPAQGSDIGSANGFRGCTSKMTPGHIMLYYQLSLTSRRKTIVFRC